MRRTVRISAQPPTRVPSRAAAHYRRPTRAPAEVGICGSHRKEINTGPRDLSTNFRRRRDAAVTISLFTRAHDTMLARVAMAQCLCLCLSQVGVLSKWMDGSSWFLAYIGFFRPILHCVIRKFRYLQKLMYFPPELCHKFRI